jgi:hypothetical protein
MRGSHMFKELKVFGMNKSRKVHPTPTWSKRLVLMSVCCKWFN